MLLQGYMYGETFLMRKVTITTTLHTIIYNMDYPFRGYLFMEIISSVTEVFLFLGICHLSKEKLSDKKSTVKQKCFVVSLYFYLFLVTM